MNILQSIADFFLGDSITNQPLLSPSGSVAFGVDAPKETAADVRQLGHAADMMTTTYVLDEVFAERQRQDEKWGEQNHPDFWPTKLPQTAELRATYYGVPQEGLAKHNCELAFAAGRGSWADILVDEVSEAIGAPNVEALREELVQVAAVAVKWVEAIDRRTSASMSAKEGTP